VEAGRFGALCSSVEALTVDIACREAVFVPRDACSPLTTIPRMGHLRYTAGTISTVWSRRRCTGGSIGRGTGNTAWRVQREVRVQQLTKRAALDYDFTAARLADGDIFLQFLSGLIESEAFPVKALSELVPSSKAA
jgi:hypothetical protein